MPWKNIYFICKHISNLKSIQIYYFTLVYEKQCEFISLIQVNCIFLVRHSSLSRKELLNSIYVLSENNFFIQWYFFPRNICMQNFILTYGKQCEFISLIQGKCIFVVRQCLSLSRKQLLKSTTMYLFFLDYKFLKRFSLFCT